MQLRNGITGAFAVGLLLLAAVGIISYRDAKREEKSREGVAHTYQVLRTLDAVENNIVEAEGRQRTFLLSGETERLSAYEQNIMGVSNATTQLRQLTSDNPAQQHNLDLLESLTQARIARLRNGIEMRTQHGIAGSIEVVREGKGAMLMREVKSQLDSMKRKEQELLELRTMKANKAFHENLLAIIFGNIFAVALLFASGVAVTRELKDRKIAEKALRESEERFRLVVADVTTYAILTLDPQGHVATWNAGAERIKGYNAEEIIGKHFSIFYRQEDIAAGTLKKKLLTASDEGRFEDEGWRVRKDGSLFWANVVITAMRATDGHLIGFSEVIRDLTEPKRAEEEISKLNAHLQQHVVELTSTNRELDAFTYSLAHDLRAPLRHINGFANVLHEDYGGQLNPKGSASWTKSSNPQKIWVSWSMSC